MTHPAAGRLTRRLPPLGWDTWLLLAAVLAQGVVAVWLGSRGWFSGDLLHYYVERGGAPGGSESLMAPHSSHWQLTLVLVYLMMFKLIGLTTYVPYLVLTVAVHLALVVALHRLLRHVGAGRPASFVAAVVLLTYGAGSEAFLVEAPVALTASLLLGCLALLHLVRHDLDGRSCLRAGVLLLVSVTISLGGVVAAVWVGVFALSRGVRPMLRVVAVPAVCFVVWFAVWGRDSSRVLLDREDVLRVPESAAALLVAPFDNVSGGWGAGPVLLVAVLLAAVVSARRSPLLVQLSLAGLVGAVFHAVVSAVAQVPFGIEQVTTSRYRYVVLALLLPGLALLLDTALAAAARTVDARTTRPLVVLGASVGCLALVHAALGQYRVVQGVETLGDLTRTHLAGTIVASDVGEELLTDAVRGSYISGEDLERLADPALRSELPDLRPTEQDRIEAESNYYVAVTDDELRLAPPAELDTDSFSPELSPRPGCRTYQATNATPTVVLRSFLGAGFRFHGDARSVTTTLTRPDEDLESDPVAWRVEPEEWTYVATTAQVADLAVTFDRGGAYTFCFGS